MDISSTVSMRNPSLRVRLVGALLGLCWMGIACNSGSGTAASEVSSPESPTSSPEQATAAGTGCENPYFPIAEGATSTWRVTSSLGEAVRTATIKDVGPGGFSIEKVGELSGGREYTWVEKWSCTLAGLVQYPTGELAAVATGLNGEVTASVGENSGPTLPRHIQAGDTWSQTFNGDVTGNDSTTNWTVVYNFSAIGLEQVTVPAGTFTAMKLTNHITWPNSGIPEMDGTYWFVQGVGLVKYVFSMGGEDLGTSELVSSSSP